MEALSYLVTALVAYFMGSIPTGFLVAKARGVDIRAVGSGNIGATNVLRILGKPAGILVLVADAFKGWCAVVGGVRAVFWLFHLAPDPAVREYHALVAAFCAVLGHNYTCWLGFKGGKGIATSAGVLLAVVPKSLAIILTIFLVVFGLTRYVSLGSVAASIALPFAAWLTGESTVIIAVTGLMGALALYKHKANIRRLLNGTESRVGVRKTEAAG